MKEEFGKYHPTINLLYFICAIGFSMCFRNEGYRLVSFIVGTIYYFMLMGAKGIFKFIWMIIIFFAISYIFGFTSGDIMITVLLFFTAYNIIMTNDKFVYLFGKIIPAVSLLLTMILRYVPEFQRRFNQIVIARKGIGKYEYGTNRFLQMRQASILLGLLTAWSMEDAIIKADSMKNRGYGLTPRTTFAIYKFKIKDDVILSIMILLLILLGVFIYFNFNLVGQITYGIFLAIPICIEIKEKILWHILRSKI